MGDWLCDFSAGDFSGPTKWLEFVTFILRASRMASVFRLIKSSVNPIKNENLNIVMRFARWHHKNEYTIKASIFGSSIYYIIFALLILPILLTGLSNTLK